MTDREKVIKEFALFIKEFHPACTSEGVELDMFGEVLALLKEQEAVEPILKREGRNKYYNYYVCPRCNEEVVYDQNYCSECGAKFMWEGR